MYQLLSKNKSSYKNKILKSLNQTLKETRVENFIRRDIKLEKNIIRINQDVIDLEKGNLYVAGWGKLSPYLAKSFLKNVGIKNIKKGLFISNNVQNISKKIKILKGTHPYPTIQTYKASLQMVKFLRSLKPNDYIIFLISGGGSSIFSIPHKNILMEEKIIISKKLISRGIEPKLINNIRKFTSKIKGGKLLNEMNTKKIFNIFISDENQNLMHSIASGCTVLQKWNFKKLNNELKYLRENNILSKKLLHKIDLLVIENQKYQKQNKFIEKINYTSKSHEIENMILTQTRPQNNQVIKTKIVLDNSKFKKLVQKNLQTKVKKNVILSHEFLFGNYDLNKQKIFSKIDSINEKEFFLVLGLQVEIDLKKKIKNAKGGRLQHLCLDLALNFKNKNFDDFLISGFASDGDDFLKKIGGVMISKRTISKFTNEKILKYLKSNRSYNFHAQAGSIINSKKPTKCNVMDILVLFIKKN